MFDFRRITLFCLEKRLSKHKMATFSKNFLGGMAPLPPLAMPMPATRDTFRMKYDVKAVSSNVQVPLL